MKMKIGIVGIGAISGIYLENITNVFREIEIAGVCDLVRERAEQAVKQYQIPKLYEDMYELFDDPEVDIVLNLTRPYEHYEVTMAALKAGKHVYSEKPLAASLAEGKEIVAFAREKGLRVGGPVHAHPCPCCCPALAPDHDPCCCHGLLLLPPYCWTCGDQAEAHLASDPRAA